MNKLENQQATQEKAKEKVEFRIQLITFIVVNAILAIINLIFTPGYLWFIWPLLGWGIGITLHAIRVNSKGKVLKRK